MGRFTTPIDLEIVREPNIWRTIQPLNFDSDKYGHIVVPAGFETDLASVPRIPVAYLLAGATANAAAVVHDWLYRNGVKFKQITKKEEADNIFYEAMEATEVPLWRRWLMYQAVNWFGRGAFKA